MAVCELFIGITTWNSERLLPTCLDAILRNCRGTDYRICVVDNASEDESVSIAKAAGAQVLVRQCTQQQALNALIRRSRGYFTLLLHADVVLLDEGWFDVCRRHIGNGVVLVSPEDIGCGPLTRPFGAGKPESSFLLFETEGLRRCLKRRWHGLIPKLELDLSGSHLTHDIPTLLAKHQLRWKPMNVYPSNRTPERLYTSKERPPIWSDELAYLRYGLGNFYGLGNIITHYHNWYERAVTPHSSRHQGKLLSKQKREFPSDFIDQYTQRFLDDYAANAVDLPADLTLQRIPKAL